MRKKPSRHGRVNRLPNGEPTTFSKNLAPHFSNCSTNSRSPALASTFRRYYKDSIAALGGFPTRKKPEAIYPAIDTQRRFLSYDRLNDEISGYKLSLFAPSRYLKESAKLATKRMRATRSARQTAKSFWSG